MEWIEPAGAPKCLSIKLDLPDGGTYEVTLQGLTMQPFVPTPAVKYVPLLGLFFVTIFHTNVFFFHFGL